MRLEILPLHQTQELHEPCQGTAQHSVPSPGAPVPVRGGKAPSQPQCWGDKGLSRTMQLPWVGAPAQSPAPRQGQASPELCQGPWESSTSHSFGTCQILKQGLAEPMAGPRTGAHPASPAASPTGPLGHLPMQGHPKHFLRLIALI